MTGIMKDPVDWCFSFHGYNVSIGGHGFGFGSVLFAFPFSAPLSWWQRNPCTNKCRNVNKIRQRERIFQRIEGVFTSLATSLHFKSVFVCQMWSRDNIENMSWKLLLLSNALLKIVEMSCFEKRPRRGVKFH